MSTRGFLGVRFDGLMNGSYNHMDSYPSELGEEVVDFCRALQGDEELFKAFNKNIREVKWVDPQGKPTRTLVHRIRVKCAIPLPRVVEGMTWYDTLRDYQGIGYFYQVMMKKLPVLPDDSEFMKDSLFCEYGYIIDLDRKTLEFYKGKQRVYGNITQYPGEIFTDSEGRRFVYGACKKVGEVSFRTYIEEGWKAFFSSSSEKPLTGEDVIMMVGETVFEEPVIEEEQPPEETAELAEPELPEKKEEVQVAPAPEQAKQELDPELESLKVELPEWAKDMGTAPEENFPEPVIVDTVAIIEKPVVTIPKKEKAKRKTRSPKKPNGGKLPSSPE